MRSRIGLAAGAVFVLAVGLAAGQAADNYQKAVNDAYTKYKDLKEGANADYIPALAKVNPDLYGIVLVTTDGKVYTAGDVKSEVSIQSISKVFTAARVIEDKGEKSMEASKMERD